MFHTVCLLRRAVLPLRSPSGTARALSAGLCLLMLAGTIAAAEPQQPAAPTATPTPSKDVTLNDLERKFSEKLSGSALVGRFTVDGQDPSRVQTERYEIESATKLNNDDYWVILARVKYGKHDLKVPVTLKVLWAGDTPVMSLTDLTIPLMGTFTARVMFYDNRYVGTWQHGEKGGHMLGYVEKQSAATGK